MMSKSWCRFLSRWKEHIIHFILDMGLTLSLAKQMMDFKKLGNLIKDLDEVHSS